MNLCYTLRGSNSDTAAFRQVCENEMILQVLVMVAPICLKLLLSYILKHSTTNHAATRLAAKVAPVAHVAHFTHFCNDLESFVNILFGVRSGNTETYTGQQQRRGWEAYYHDRQIAL